MLYALLEANSGHVVLKVTSALLHYVEEYLEVGIN